MVKNDGIGALVYEAAVFLLPEGVDLVAEYDAAVEYFGDTYYDALMSEIVATRLGCWEFDPTAAAGEYNAIPDFE